MPRGSTGPRHLLSSKSAGFVRSIHRARDLEPGRGLPIRQALHTEDEHGDPSDDAPALHTTPLPGQKRPPPTGPVPAGSTRCRRPDSVESCRGAGCVGRCHEKSAMGESRPVRTILLTADTPTANPVVMQNRQTPGNPAICDENHRHHRTEKRDREDPSCQTAALQMGRLPCTGDAGDHAGAIDHPPRTTLENARIKDFAFLQ